MEEEKSVMKVSDRDGTKVAVLESSKMLDELDISEIGAKLTEVIQGGGDKGLVIDFRNVSNMSSSALGMLITIHKRMREISGELRLCNINDNIKEVFDITRLNEILIIDESVEDSLANIKK